MAELQWKKGKANEGCDIFKADCSVTELSGVTGPFVELWAKLFDEMRLRQISDFDAIECDLFGEGRLLVYPLRKKGKKSMRLFWVEIRGLDVVESNWLEQERDVFKNVIREFWRCLENALQDEQVRPLIEEVCGTKPYPVCGTLNLHDFPELSTKTPVARKAGK